MAPFRCNRYSDLNRSNGHPDPQCYADSASGTPKQCAKYNSLSQ